MMDAGTGRERADSGGVEDERGLESSTKTQAPPSPPPSTSATKTTQKTGPRSEPR